MVNAVDGGGGAALTPQPTQQLYEVTGGETVGWIADTFGVTPESLIEANSGLERASSDTVLSSGSVLTIPAAASSVLQDAPDPAFNAGGESPAINYSPGANLSVTTDQGAVVWNPDLQKATLRSTQSAGIEESVGNARGSLSVQFQRALEGELAVRHDNEDGNTVLHVTVTTARTGSASAEVDGRHPLVRAGIEAGTAFGTGAGYKVILPGENRDPGEAARINPFDPTTIPVGARVVLNAETFDASELSTFFSVVGSRTRLTEVSGASVSIERTAEGQVQVMTGPYEAVSSLRLGGLDTEAVRAGFGREVISSDSTLETARFDIATEGGQAAFEHFLWSGQVADMTEGVSEVMTLRQIDLIDSPRTVLEIGEDGGTELGIDIAGMPSTSSSTSVTFPDGSEIYTATYGTPGNVPLTVVSRFDAEGAEIVSERTFIFELGEVDTYIGQRILGGMGRGDQMAAVEGGDMRLSFTQAQMSEILGLARERARIIDENGGTGGGYDPIDPSMLDGLAGYEDEVFGFAHMWSMYGSLMGGSAYGEKLADQLFNLSEQSRGDAFYDGDMSRLPGTLEIEGRVPFR